MKHMAVGKFALLTATLICIGSSQILAQATNHRDEGTAKRSYGDPLPGGAGGTATERMTLLEAAQSGGVAEARAAFLIGESVNSRTPRGAPALLVAAQSGNIAVLRFLLEKGANPNLFDKSTGKTALIAAAELGDGGMTHLLLQHKAEPQHQDRQGRTQPLNGIFKDFHLSLRKCSGLCAKPPDSKVPAPVVQAIKRFVSGIPEGLRRHGE